MIVITEIKTREVNRNAWERAKFNCDAYFEASSGDVAETVRFTNEVVLGKDFKNAHGKTVCIGMTKEVQEAIGLPFEAFEELQKLIEEFRQYNQLLFDRIERTEKRLKEYSSLSFLGRLKYLFTRKV